MLAARSDAYSRDACLHAWPRQTLPAWRGRMCRIRRSGGAACCTGTRACTWRCCRCACVCMKRRAEACLRDAQGWCRDVAERQGAAGWVQCVVGAARAAPSSPCLPCPRPHGLPAPHPPQLVFTLIFTPAGQLDPTYCDQYPWDRRMQVGEGRCCVKVACQLTAGQAGFVNAVHAAFRGTSCNANSTTALL